MRRVSDVQTLLLAAEQIAGLDAELAQLEIKRIAAEVIQIWKHVFREHANQVAQSVDADFWRDCFEGFQRYLHAPRN